MNETRIRYLSLLSITLLVLASCCLEHVGELEHETLFISQISAGNSHSLALCSDGSLWGWGQLGYPYYDNASFSSPILLMSSVCKAFSFGDSCAAIKEDGSLWAWTSFARQPLLVTERVLNVTSDFMLASIVVLKDDYSVWIHDFDYDWYPGDDLHLFELSASLPVVSVKQLALSGCGYILQEDGALLSFEISSRNALTNLIPVMDSVAAIDARSQGMLIVTSEGLLIDHDNRSGDRLFTDMSDITKVRDARLGGSAGIYDTFFALIIMEDSTLWGCGYNEQGQLGIKTANGYQNKPALIMSDVSLVAAGYTHSLALLNDGTLLAWGSNAFGQLGVDSVESSFSPQKVVFGK